jgi:hypothetical protein
VYRVPLQSEASENLTAEPEPARLRHMVQDAIALCWLAGEHL